MNRKVRRIAFRVPYKVLHTEVAEYVYQGTSETDAVAEAIQYVRRHVPGAIVSDPQKISDDVVV